jgi:hypothetical protein
MKRKKNEGEMTLGRRRAVRGRTGDEADIWTAGVALDFDAVDRTIVGQGLEACTLPSRPNTNRAICQQIYNNNLEN